MTRYKREHLCVYCKHLNREGATAKDSRLVSNCLAYPDEIPAKYLNAYEHHIRPPLVAEGVYFEPENDPELLAHMSLELREVTGL